MKKIVVLTTGGTIASVENEKNGKLSSGAMPGEELLKQVDLHVDAELVVESVFQVPSNHMTFERLTTLRDRVNQVLEDPDVSGVVITHGTDTMEESAYFLDLTLNHERPVVITGSQRGPGELGTDAFVNIRQAILTAASPDSKGLGVVVVFNERIIAARFVTKAHSYNVAAFTAFGQGHLGQVDHDDVEVHQRPARREHIAINGEVPRVELLKFPLGADGALVDAAVASGAKGIVLEGSGRGHIPPFAVESIQAAVASGVRVVLTTSCEEPRVYPVYDFAGGVMDLSGRGVIPGGNYQPKKARIKLALLLGAGVHDTAELARRFAQ